MSGETTKSSDGREQLNVEEVATVEKQIKDAGYFFRFNAMQSQFSKTKIKDDNTATGTGADTTGGGSSKPVKAGEHTFVGNKFSVIFRNIIPFIARGSKGKVKKADIKDRKNKETSQEQGTNEKHVEDR